MRPGEVLDARGDLNERLGNPEFRRLIDSFGDMEYGRSGGYKGGTDVSTMLGQLLKVAETYRVTHDMSLLVQHAADQLDDLDRIDLSLAPSRCGFVAFDRPLPLIDQRGKTMLVHYLLWGPALMKVGDYRRETATLIFSFNDAWREPDEVQKDWEQGRRQAFYKADGMTDEEFSEMMGRGQYEEYSRIMGRWATVGSQPLFNEQRLGPQKAMPSAHAQAKLLAEGITPHEGTNMNRYVHALWLMMGQTVAKVEDEYPDRTSRRRAERRKLPPKVTVIKLRRENSEYHRKEGESLVEWSHRWVVKGHWRWQVCGEHHPLAQEIEPGKFRCRIWIAPFVKGPADKPFSQSEKIYSLER